MKIVAKTDIGRIRQQNQDSYAAGELPGGVAWAVVCDGMGGAAGGDVASTLAVKMISEKITSAYQDGMGSGSIKNMLVSVIESANVSIYDMARSNETLHGMGTTVVAAVVVGSAVYIAHAGDSRAYRITPEAIQQITRDHSVVQAMVETGELTPDEAKHHPRKNLITRVLGMEQNILTDFNETVLQADDVIILCTDGLSNYVETDDIYALTKGGNYYEFAEKLVSLANGNGGGDNITVVAIAS